MVSAYKVHIEISNILKNELQLRSKANLAHGVWVSTLIKISLGMDKKFQVDADGFMTGVEGAIFYKVFDGEITLYFDHPYIGSDKFRAYSSSPTTQARVTGR
ncbi:hypothetical protein MHB44_10825 [Lysinibacillus sp. FSL H8-0500]|uniref:hypothetical protein n=1 Tax=Lysinibacillus sp. FSL H8-0500 TaxID=2921393 RepID=UPI003101947A